MVKHSHKENRELNVSLGKLLRTLGECNMVIKMKIVIILISFLCDLSLFYATVVWTCVAPSWKRLCWWTHRVPSAFQLTL